MNDKGFITMWSVLIRFMYVSFTFTATAFIRQDGAAAIPVLILGASLIITLDILVFLYAKRGDRL